MSGKQWEQNETLLLMQKQKERVPHKVTAKLLGRTVRAVTNHASDNGILQPRKGRWTKAEDDKLYRLLFVDCNTRAYAAQQLNRTEFAVRQRMNRLGWRTTVGYPPRPQE